MAQRLEGDEELLTFSVTLRASVAVYAPPNLVEQMNKKFRRTAEGPERACPNPSAVSLSPTLSGPTAASDASAARGCEQGLRHGRGSPRTRAAGSRRARYSRVGQARCERKPLCEISVKETSFLEKEQPYDGGSVLEEGM